MGFSSFVGLHVLLFVVVDATLFRDPSLVLSGVLPGIFVFRSCLNILLFNNIF